MTHFEYIHEPANVWGEKLINFDLLKILEGAIILQEIYSMCNGRTLNAWIEHGDQESLALWENDQEEVIELSLADQLNHLITSALRRLKKSNSCQNPLQLFL